ncbi:MAG: alpha/beta fold hydrolase [Myxococcaceae bacterium]|jgi:pimeloyl-ACP methyl ester carboxylesterase|nr:alpha/beta fold hydrolase [Myxococcaceae bacterium]MCA3015140.1 alpha/beta fold hydrolase [Myxococcaceae bacterium]
MNLLEAANRTMRRLLVAQGVESEVRRVRGHEVHAYRLEGKGLGPPLLLVHGLGSSANAYWRTIKPLSLFFRRVWAVDVPGNGFSPTPAGGPLAWREQLATVRAFLEEVVAEPVFLIGNSLGGAMSLYLAHETPASVRALGLISPAGARLEPERFRALVQSFEVNTRAEARAMTRRLFARPPLPLLLLPGQMQKLYENPTVRSLIREVRPEDSVSEAMLAGLSMPTLLIWGTHEKLLPPEGLAYFREHLPGHAEVHEVEGFGHMPQMENPRPLVRKVVDFARAKGLAG